MAFEHFVGGQTHRGHVALVEVVEFADPGTEGDHVDADDGKSYPLWPSQKKLLLALFQLSVLAEPPQVERREEELIE